MEENEYQLQLALQQSHSLASIQTSGLTSYEPIGTPILVDTTQAVASK